MAFKPRTNERHIPWRSIVQLPRAKTEAAKLLDDLFHAHPIQWPADFSAKDKAEIVNWPTALRAETFHDWLKECHTKKLLSARDLHWLVDEMIDTLYPRKADEKKEPVSVATQAGENPF